jgi:plastocyanin
MWRDGDLAYCLVADPPADEVMAFARGQQAERTGWPQDERFRAPHRCTVWAPDLPASSLRKEVKRMRNSVPLGIPLTLAGLALIAVVTTDAVANPDRLVVVHSGALREAVTAVTVGEPVTWVNASGTPVVRVVFDPDARVPDSTGLFTSSVTMQFRHPGVYAYTAFVGGRAWPVRGKIVVR